MRSFKVAGIPLTVVAVGLMLGGCVETWDKVVAFVAQPPETEEISTSEIAVLAEFETAAGGQTAHPAAQHIEKLGKEVMTVMRDPAATTDKRIKDFGGILARDLDIALIGRFVLGKHWKKASDQQRAAYLDVFQQFVVQTYSARLGGVEVDSFEVVGTKGIGKKDILVKCKVAQASSKAIRADWRMRPQDGTFRILDLSVEGISMAMTLRKEFGSVLRKKAGVDGLIEMLKGRTT